MSKLNLKFVVFVTERDQFGNEKEVKTDGHRFAMEADGTLTVLGGDHDRVVAAWARGRWVKVASRLEKPDA